jgi:hypothetical protein
LKSGINHSVSREGGELLQQKNQKGRLRAFIFLSQKIRSSFVTPERSARNVDWATSRTSFLEMKP